MISKFYDWDTFFNDDFLKVYLLDVVSSKAEQRFEGLKLTDESWYFIF